MAHRIIKAVCCLVILWALFALNHYGTVLSKRNSSRKKGNIVIAISYILIVIFVLLVIFVIRKM